MPVIGSRSAVSHGDAMRGRLAALRQGLAETGYVEGRNASIEYRWAKGRFDRLPELAADLVRRQVSVMIAVSEPGALAAKAATPTIPIVFSIAEDPVALGLVANIARPGGNATGVNFLTGELVPKRMGILREPPPLGLACSSIRAIPGVRRPRRERRRRLRAPWSGKCTCSKPARAGRSIRLLARSRANALKPSSSGQTRSSPAGAFNLRSWPRGMRFPRPTQFVTSPKPGD